ncbi:hypothetical protein ABZ897_55290 [Nonomuraea sp. NPDC046802]|uniref:hypothetical protein n=1 Tax=Nonomuraea sp. NPDC046802 TaxID=3154919 RepID=UPI0033F881FC
MTPGTDNDSALHLRRTDAVALAGLLRELERFLDDCDESVADALDDYFGFRPVAESFSAALAIHADRLDALLTSPTPTTEGDTP